MSNGAQCCALEICCPDSPTKRMKLATSIATFTGSDPSHCTGFFDWMDDNNLIFAPKEFAPTLQAIADMARAHPNGE